MSILAQGILCRPPPPRNGFVNKTCLAFSLFLFVSIAKTSKPNPLPPQGHEVPSVWCKQVARWRQQDGNIHPTSGLLVTCRCDVLDAPATVASLAHRSTQLQELRNLLAQFSKMQAELQQNQSHACHLRSKFLMVEEMRTQDPERAFAEAQQVEGNMLIDGRSLSELVALEAALQQQLHHLRTDAG